MRRPSGNRPGVGTYTAAFPYRPYTGPRMHALMTPEFWIAVGQIIMIDILLGGDNAVVIALACRKLPPAQRRLGILWGTAGAIALRVVLIFFALTLLQIPFLKLVGADGSKRFLRGGRNGQRSGRDRGEKQRFHGLKRGPCSDDAQCVVWPVDFAARLSMFRASCFPRLSPSQR